MIASPVEQPLILILSDINMPGMSGLEMLPKVKEMRPEVPVIMITAYGDPETKRKAIEGGADGLADQAHRLRLASGGDRRSAWTSELNRTAFICLLDINLTIGPFPDLAHRVRCDAEFGRYPGQAAPIKLDLRHPRSGRSPYSCSKQLAPETVLRCQAASPKPKTSIFPGRARQRPLVQVDVRQFPASILTCDLLPASGPLALSVA